MKPVAEGYVESKPELFQVLEGQAVTASKLYGER